MTHYNFRLEFNNTLVSWVVPKELSADPREKRLAIQTEGHSLNFIDLEGFTPEGEYSAGTVLLWETGTYKNLRAEQGPDSQSMEYTLGDGLTEVWLEGQKLRGDYTMKRIEQGKIASSALCRDTR